MLIPRGYSTMQLNFSVLSEPHIPKSIILIVFFMSIVLVWFVGLGVVKLDHIHLSRVEKLSIDCVIHENSALDPFIVYAPSKSVAETLTQQLCHDPTVARQFSQIRTYWGYKISDSIDFLGKGIADLILAKENLMQAFAAELTYNYVSVAGYPAYTAYFMSLKEKPRLEKAYFLDKKIGLLDYPSSRSGHMLPKGKFKQLGIELENLDIVYVNSHMALRDLLANGQVDIIASYWQQEDSLRFSQNYIAPISSNISGSKWYLKMTQQNPELLCSVQSVLSEHARQQSSSYYNQITIFHACDVLTKVNFTTGGGI